MLHYCIHRLHVLFFVLFDVIDFQGGSFSLECLLRTALMIYIRSYITPHLADMLWNWSRTLTRMTFKSKGTFLSFNTVEFFIFTSFLGMITSRY